MKDGELELSALMCISQRHVKHYIVTGGYLCALRMMWGRITGASVQG